MTSRQEIKGDLTFVALSDTGSSHLRNGTCNQDAVDYKCSGTDFMLVVSDGVSSCANAETGSKAVTTAAGNVFQKVVDHKLAFSAESIINAFVSEWRLAVNDENLNDYGATMKMAIRIGNHLRLFSLGDGFIAVTSSGFSLTSPEEKSSFVNMTRCLCAETSSVDFWSGEFALDTYVPFVVFGCTDGIANCVAKGKEIDLVREIESQIPNEELEHQLKDFMAEIAEYSRDDKTIGVVKYEQSNGQSMRKLNNND